MRPVLSCAAIFITTVTTLVAQQTSSPLAVRDYYDIGKIHHRVSTESDVAQRWFDRGLAMCIGFNHEEAVRCFEKALVADPSLAMGYWGLAYAWGPNINNMEIVPHQMAQAQFALRLAELHADSSRRTTPFERDLIAATRKRHATPVPEDRRPLNQAYVDDLRKLHQRYPDSPLGTALFAEALMNLQPWKHYAADGTPGKHTVEVRRVLEGGLVRWPEDPALCHLYIHVMEASPTPEKALPAANRLRNAVPGSGHLVHMPSHIDVLVGDYDKVIEMNRRAIEEDRKFLEREGPLNFYSFYRIHNYHFLVYGAMFDGQSQLALKTARELTTQVPEGMLREQVDFLDAFMPTPLHVLVRFGKWDQILEEPEPADYLPVSRSIWHYARALAFAATGRVEEAEEERSEFEDVADTVPDTSFLFQNSSQDILRVAEAMIDGEIAYRKGDFEAAFEHLRVAVRRDDALNYDEPWGWMQPARHALGALLLEQGRAEESEAVYREDLRRHPHNPWALQGLAESLRRQGQTAEAEKVAAELKAATVDSDVEIDRSCFCRLTTD